MTEQAPRTSFQAPQRLWDNSPRFLITKLLVALSSGVSGGINKRQSSRMFFGIKGQTNAFSLTTAPSFQQVREVSLKVNLYRLRWHHCSALTTENFRFY